MKIAGILRDSGRFMKVNAKFLTTSAVILAGTSAICYKAHSNRMEIVNNRYEVLTSGISNNDLNKIESRVETGKITWKQANDSLKADKAIKDSIGYNTNISRDVFEKVSANAESHKQTWAQIKDSLRYLKNSGLLKK